MKIFVFEQVGGGGYAVAVVPAFNQKNARKKLPQNPQEWHLSGTIDIIQMARFRTRTDPSILIVEGTDSA